jgi:hypothetical protein
MRISLGRAAAAVAAPVLLLALGASSAAGLSPGTTAAAGQARPAAATARFDPVSASFTSYQAGYVLGTRGHTRLPGAVYLVRTINGGRTWTAVAAPKVRLVDPSAPAPGTAVSAVRFADMNNGWLFSPALWVTHDGGRHWRQLSLPGKVGAVAVSNGMAFASVMPAGGAATGLYMSQVGTDRWIRMPGVVPRNALTFYGRAGWAGLPPTMWATSDLRHWHKLPAFHAPRYYEAASLAAGSATRLLLLCTGPGGMGHEEKLLYASANGGRTFSKVGTAPFVGFAGHTDALAIPPGRPLVVTLASSSAESWLGRSVNGGRTWQTVQYNDGGIGWRDLRYASPTVGWIVHGNLPFTVNYNGLMRTVNAGATWYNVVIP